MKLHFTKYQNEFDAFTLIFDLLKLSLQNLGDKAFGEFMESKREPHDAGLERALAMLASHGLKDSVGPQLEKSHKKKMSQNYPITKHLKWAEYKGEAQFGLNASELILRVALFESFMKEIHRHALIADPRLLSHSKPNRLVKLKDLFQAGFECFKTKEIDRQVREADRLTTKDRAKFFQRKLKLVWGEDPTIVQADKLIKARHNLVHAKPNAPVTDTDIANARTLFVGIPRKCFQQATHLYRGPFQSDNVE